MADWLGKVYVVAGTAPALPRVCAMLVQGGAYVAQVRADGTGPDVHVAVRADPSAPDTWDRVAPHVEQRLGPIDGVVADVALVALLDGVFGPDLRRRGHGAVVAVTPQDEPSEVLNRLAAPR